MRVSVEFSAKPGVDGDPAQRFESFTRRAAAAQSAERAAARPSSTWSEANRPQPRKDAERERGMAAFVGRLRECPVLDYKFVVLRPQHHSRRRRRGRAQCRADALGRDARLMIVMKFGGTSVESAAAIERVAGIVKARLARKPVVVVSAMGKTTNKLLAIASAAIDGKRDEYIRQLHDLRDYHSREARQVVSAGRPRRARPHRSTSIFRSSRNWSKASPCSAS